MLVVSRMWTNSKTTAYNYGAGLGIHYNIPGNFKITGNLTYAKLQRKSSNDGLEDGFNTPEWIVNTSLGNENIFRNFGLIFHTGGKVIITGNHFLSMVMSPPIKQLTLNFQSKLKN